ncbi:hypothetical protein [Nocardia brasiliensis]|uniref:hypothetical protein n=1 Tax=Nocardia brasiliensis TaxID=37326 RepID=UPI001EEC686A|nr:hypothetical protein [Nocardia brasiliensis]
MGAGAKVDVVVAVVGLRVAVGDGVAVGVGARVGVAEGVVGLALVEDGCTVGVRADVLPQAGAPREIPAIRRATTAHCRGVVVMTCLDSDEDSAIER